MNVDYSSLAILVAIAVIGSLSLQWLTPRLGSLLGSNREGDEAAFQAVTQTLHLERKIQHASTGIGFCLVYAVLIQDSLICCIILLR